MPESSTSPWTAAARLLRPQGRRGELLAEPLSDLPGILSADRRVSIAASPASAALETTIESVWSPTGRNAGRLVLKLAGIDSISAAETVAGRDLLVPAVDMPALEPDTWFVSDLIGCTLFDGERPVGQITGVEYSMTPDGRQRLPEAPPLLEVSAWLTDGGNLEASSAAPSLVPFLKAWLDSVNLDQRRVVMHLPPGLLEVSSIDRPGE